jgi:hypothetical protein
VTDFLTTVIRGLGTDDKVIKKASSREMVGGGGQDSRARFAGGGRRSRTPPTHREREREREHSCFRGFLLASSAKSFLWIKIR